MTPGEEADAAVASAGGAAAEASAASSRRPPRSRAAAAAPAASRRPAKPVHGIRLVLSVLWERVVRFFARLVGRGEK